VSAAPEEIRNKPYMQNIKSTEDLFKAFDGAQTLLGKKNNLPAVDAPAEEWETYFKRIRPENEAAYGFVVKDDAPDASFRKAMAQVCFKAGLPVKQAKMVAEGFDAVVAKLYEEDEAAKTLKIAEQKQQFQTKVTSLFGADRDKVLAQSAALFNEFAPKEFAGIYEKLDADAKVALAAVLHGIQTKHISEDRPSAVQGSAPQNVLQTKEDVMNAMVALKKTAEWTNQMHPGHREVEAKIKELETKYFNLK